jgi:SRSO17 transposase
MLLILVVDTRSNAAVWQGTTTGTGTNPASAVGAAERATDRLLREVPKSGQ